MRGTVLFIVGMLCFSTCVTTGLPSENSTVKHSFSLSFGEPSLIDDGEYINVQMQGAPACVYCPGQPVLPLFTTTLQLPFGSRIKAVTLDVGSIGIKMLQKKIIPAPYPFLDGMCVVSSESSLHTKWYESTDFYPLQPLTYVTGGGLDETGNHVTFMTVRVCPIQYSPATDMLRYFDSCHINIIYEPPTQSPFPSVVTNDLVIICPSQFVRPLERLADHKNSLGIRTKIITLNEIYDFYSGYDRPEQIKYFIKDALEDWGTSYVLLVGGLKSHLNGKPRDNLNTGTSDWYVPVRYTNLWDVEAVYDPGFISDLYYADIYDGSGQFCNWDSCNDGVYGGWANPARIGDPNYPTDVIDFYPDVYLGRLPCRNIFEVRTMVRKIIAYENNPADQSWFNKMVVVGGDPYNDKGTNYAEGEIIGEKASSYMTGFEKLKLFASYRETNPEYTPITRNIVREINKGCGFLLFDGHGGPAWWNTYWPSEFGAFIKHGGLSVYQFYQLKNREALPVCIVGGCHNNLFNVSLMRTIADPRNIHSMWSNGAPISECWGWSLTAKPKGGAIATIGNTALGYEAGGEVGDLNGDAINEPDCVEALCGYLEVQFFKGYGKYHIDTLGNLWSNAIGKYLQIYPGMENLSDAKTIEQWVLLGDPSLKIGGYST